MKTRTITPVSLLFIMLFGLAVAMPASVEASSCYGGYGYSYGPGYGHSHHHHHHHHKKRYYKKKHYYKRHNPYYGGYNRAYNPPRRYYNQPYYNQPYYGPQPGYGYAPRHMGYPPNMTLGINTGNASFMIRY